MEKHVGFPSVVPLPPLLHQTCLQQVVATRFLLQLPPWLGDGVGLGENGVGLEAGQGWVGKEESFPDDQINAYFLGLCYVLGPVLGSGDNSDLDKHHCLPGTTLVRRWTVD